MYPLRPQTLLFMKEVNFELKDDIVEEEDSLLFNEMILKRVLLRESEGSSEVLLIKISVWDLSKIIRACCKLSSVCKWSGRTLKGE